MWPGQEIPSFPTVVGFDNDSPFPGGTSWNDVEDAGSAKSQLPTRSLVSRSKRRISLPVFLEPVLGKARDNRSRVLSGDRGITSATATWRHALPAQQGVAFVGSHAALPGAVSEEEWGIAVRDGRNGRPRALGAQPVARQETKTAATMLVVTLMVETTSCVSESTVDPVGKVAKGD